MPWKWRVGWLGLGLFYVAVAFVLVGVHVATSSGWVQYAVLFAVIILGPTRASIGIERHAPIAVVATSVLVTAAIAAAILGIEIAVTNLSGLRGGPAFDLWVVMVPAITAGVEAGRRLPSRRRQS